MERISELGTFLRTRRARLSPGEVGLPDYGGRRRVPGLRREELAQLAGISPGYYTRLEQGSGANASDAVLDALARVLRLDEAERSHLYGLARPARTAVPATERVRPSVRTMIGALGEVPALVLGRSLDVLAWNRSGHALLAGHLPFAAPYDGTDGRRPNVVRMVFLDPRYRALYTDLDAKLRDSVGGLRGIAGQWPDEPRLRELITELRRESAEFTALWAAHPVRTCATHTLTYRHPAVGPITLTDENMLLPDDAGQRVVVFHAAPGSPSADALRRLADGVRVP
ncbi:helix-turn-helix transcriptional regulator [Streptomyces chattanoogensis]|uniref:XRE family transcriptional regulator n=1 Tax=Streptomyces chattanoogensis TaxID=66876 RepID=A0A0N0XUT2_9ACTN|nr:helix-turn-helix transcriptional regulator [Streptomyces chattanoogensis]KPC60257.1 XRE family transcriptional regulator [Streptomyces chattanoogensis]